MPENWATEVEVALVEHVLTNKNTNVLQKKVGDSEEKGPV